MQTSDKIDLIAKALVQAQAELKHAVKDSTNPHFRSKYADLGAVWDAAKPALSKAKIAALQDVICNENGMGVRTRLLHESGQWIEFDPPIIPLSKRDAQGAGSALTYGRRYSLSAALGVVADEDDDGNAASQGNGKADAQSTTEPEKVKNEPGISKARQWVANHLRELHAAESPKHLMQMLDDAVAMWVRIKSAYPALWTGPDGSGLRGEAMKCATIYEVRDEFDLFVSRVESLADNKSQQAAE